MTFTFVSWRAPIESRGERAVMENLRPMTPVTSSASIVTAPGPACVGTRLSQAATLQRAPAFAWVIVCPAVLFQMSPFAYTYAICRSSTFSMTFTNAAPGLSVFGSKRPIFCWSFGRLSTGSVRTRNEMNWRPVTRETGSLNTATPPFGGAGSAADWMAARTWTFRYVVTSEQSDAM